MLFLIQSFNYKFNDKIGADLATKLPADFSDMNRDGDLLDDVEVWKDDDSETQN